MIKPASGLLNLIFSATAMALALGSSSLPAWAQSTQVVLTPAADATLIEAVPDNSAGGAAFVNAGTTQNGTRNRALLQFDLAGALPTNALITACSLALSVTRQPSAGFEPSVFGLHRVLQSWGEGTNTPIGNPGGLGAPATPGDATWHSRFAQTPLLWGQPGGEAGVDFVANFSSSAFIESLGPYSFETTVDTVADAQFWLNHPEANHGWMLISESEDLPFTARRFGSREDVDYSPQLLVDFVVIPEPAPAALWAATLVMLGSWLSWLRWQQQKTATDGEITSPHLGERGQDRVAGKDQRPGLCGRRGWPNPDAVVSNRL